MTDQADEAIHYSPYEAFERGEFGAWILVCNPSFFDFSSMVEDGVVSGTWTVNRRAASRTNLMESGQRVLLWMTGGSSKFPRGFWASGELTSGVFIDDFEYSGGWKVLPDRAEEAFVGFDFNVFLNGTDIGILNEVDELREIEPLRAPQVGPPYLTSAQLLALNPLLECPFDDVVPAPKPASWAPLPTLKKVDVEHRRRTEYVGMTSAANFYEDYGYEVTDVALEKCGFDLVATHELGFKKHIEAKGISAGYPVIGLTRNEIATANRDPYWQLIVAREAHHEDGPICDVYSRERVLGALTAQGTTMADILERRAVRLNLSQVVAEFSFVGSPLTE